MLEQNNKTAMPCRGKMSEGTKILATVTLNPAGPVRCSFCGSNLFVQRRLEAKWNILNVPQTIPEVAWTGSDTVV